jgi:hypothetical protein
MIKKKISQFGEALCMNIKHYPSSWPRQGRHNKRNDPPPFLHQVSLWLTAWLHRGKDRRKASLRHKGAALARRLLTNDPTKRQQVYSPSRKRTPAYNTRSCHVKCLKWYND